MNKSALAKVSSPGQRAARSRRSRNHCPCAV